MLDLDALAHGLHTEKHQHINRMLRDYDPNLSLRRIPERDPAWTGGQRFNPPRTYGVWEENIAEGQVHWVFTLAEMSIDERVLARISENDLKKQGAPAKMAKYMALKGAQEASKAKAAMDRQAALEEEMMGIGELASRKASFRHRINGQDVIIGDTVRPVRQRLK